jgi:hypothetical protein
MVLGTNLQLPREHVIKIIFQKGTQISKKSHIECIFMPFIFKDSLIKQ